ncbi:MAG: hypothetical protein AAB676_03080 [Verrucomicrobiota bacterium]
MINDIGILLPAEVFASAGFPHPSGSPAKTRAALADTIPAAIPMPAFFRNARRL